MKSVYAIAIATVAIALPGAIALRAQPPANISTNLATTPRAATVVPASASPIEGYEKWTLVNDKPYRVASILAFLCMTPSPARTAQIRAEDAKNPHLDTSSKADQYRIRFINVHVNPIAEDAMQHQKTPVFPVGSVIVKQKLAPGTPTTANEKERGYPVPPKPGAHPELLTVMRKRESGYNPKNGDWEYLVFDGSGKRIEADGHLANCQSCHANTKETDYVFRSYIPYDIQQKMHGDAPAKLSASNK